MRKIILPLFFSLLCIVFSTTVFAQPNSGTGVDCNNAFNIPLDETCRNYPKPPNPVTGDPGDPVITGNKVYCTPNGTYPNGGKVVWFKFHPTQLSACVLLDIETTVLTTPSPTFVAAEVALYDPGAGACPGTLQDGNGGTPRSTMCFPDGNGIWAPEPPFSWANRDYYIRVYMNYSGIEQIRIRICGQQYTPPNDICTSATPIPVASAGNGVIDDNTCATPSAQEVSTITPSWICAGVLHNTAWYTFTVQTTGTATINISGVNCDNYAGVSANIQAGLLVLKPGRTCLDALNSAGAGSGSPFQQAGGTAGSPATVCSNANSFNLTTRSLPAGTKVFLAIDGTNGANCEYINSGTNNIEPIPIRLKYFTAWKEGTINSLRWITSWEQNNDRFEIQRSLDGNNFETIGSVKGSLASVADIAYKFQDNTPPLVAYYRLKQVDLDGKYTYSFVVMLKRDYGSFFDISFTNPVHSSGLITINTQQVGKVNLQIIDVSGKSLSTQVVECSRGSNRIVKDFSRLPAGNYYLLATQYESRIVRPFVKQ